MKSELLERVEKWAKEAPTRALLSFVDDKGTTTASLSCSELNRKVQNLAALLRISPAQHPKGLGLQPGATVLLVYPPGLDFIVAFLACLRAGVVAVPMHPPDPRKMKKDISMAVMIIHAESKGRLESLPSSCKTARLRTTMQRGRIGLDGAESEYCDLSGRSLTTGQIERTLRVFSTASTVDLSNNEIDQIPTALPPEVVMLDLSFNLIMDPMGIQSFQHLEELHLAFNRLTDVSILELCPRLSRVNLSGNRLMNTKGLETLSCLEQLDISENLIEFPEALRPLSLNQNLTHLTIRGNPICFKTDYRVLLREMIPSVLMLDDKKIRGTTKHRAPEGSTTKSLSYSRLYDDKKQFFVTNQLQPHPGTKARIVLPGEAVAEYDATMFLRPSSEPIHERLRASQSLPASPVHTPPPAPSSVASRSTPSQPLTVSGPYVSLYERLAQSSNSTPSFKSNAPPSRPIANVKGLANNCYPKNYGPEHAKQSHAVANEPHHTSSIKSTRTETQPSSATTRSTGGIATRTQAIPAGKTYTNSKIQQTQQTQQAQDRPATSVSLDRAGTSAANLNDKQRNVLNVIQNLIQHKRQTIQTLGRPLDDNAAVPPPRPRAFVSHTVR